MSQPSTPILMCKAKAAVARQDFVQAGQMYSDLLDKPEMADQVSVHMQYAICIEKTGQLKQSIAHCEERIHECEETGEFEALQSLRLKVNILKQVRQKKKEDDEMMSTNEAFSLDSQEIIPLETDVEAVEEAQEEPAPEPPVVRTVLAKPKAPKIEHINITEKSISEDRKKQKAAGLFGEKKSIKPPTSNKEPKELHLVDLELEFEEDKGDDIWSHRE